MVDLLHSRPSPPKGVTLEDDHGRRLNYLRISLTDRCNLRCLYCMPPGGVSKIDHDDILTLEEIGRVARVAVSMGVRKIRLTGGEPLLRRNLAHLLDQLQALEPTPDVRLTTNGTLLTKALPALVAGGVSSVNISLDTLRPERFATITGLPPAQGPAGLRAVLTGIEAALATPDLAVKINTVPLAGVNDDELLDFARWAMERPLAVRFIEYMPVGRLTAYRPERFISAAELLERLAPLGPLRPLPHGPGDGPAQRYGLPGAKGEIGLISAISSHFCDTCNRLRLTADGHLVPCLFGDQKIALRPALRAGVDDQALAGLLAQAAALKPLRHGHGLDAPFSSGCQMSRLGG